MATALAKLQEQVDDFKEEVRGFIQKVYEFAVFQRLDSLDGWRANVNRFAVFTCGGAVVGVFIAKLLK